MTKGRGFPVINAWDTFILYEGTQTCKSKKKKKKEAYVQPEDPSQKKIDSYMSVVKSECLEEKKEKKIVTNKENKRENTYTQTKFCGIQEEKK